MCSLVTGVHTCALPIFQGVSLTGADHPIRSNVSVNVDRGTLNVRETDALLAPLDRAATINCIFSAAIVGGRPPCRPRRFAAARPAMIRSRVNARSYWASAPNSENSRSEEHTSELQSLMRSSYAVFCLKKKKNKKNRQSQAND